MAEAIDGTTKRESLSVGAEAGACNAPLQRVVVIGAGWVGRQIVGQCVSHGMQVWWVDRSIEALESGKAWLQSGDTVRLIGDRWPAPIACAAGCEALLEGERTGGSGSFRICNSLGETPDNVELVIESVSEQISVKRQVLKEISARYPSSTIVVSNSSYFTPSMLKRFVSNPERFAHLHFHVPVWRTRLVDIAASQDTSEEVLAKLSAFAEGIGQRALVQRVENPGYVFNWMLKALLQSALQLKAKGVATPEEIDFAWTQVTDMELGPFGIMDQIGIDLIHQTMSAGRFVDGDEVWQPLIDVLQPLIDQNKLGVKSGEGFYKH